MENENNHMPADDQNMEETSNVSAMSEDEDAKAVSQNHTDTEETETEDVKPEEADNSEAEMTDKTAEADENAQDEEAENAEADLLPMIVESIEEEELSDLEKKKRAADKTILGFTATAAATGAIPLPLADTPLLIAQQIAMVARITDIYQLNLKKSGLKSLVFTVLGVSGTTVLGKTITGSLFKALPEIGSIGGAAVCGSTAGVLTAALGKAYSEICQSVLVGDLDEDDLFGAEGRRLLETSFKNHLRLEMNQKNEEEKAKDDVLKRVSIPADEDPIEMKTAIMPIGEDAVETNTEEETEADPAGEETPSEPEA